jgi:phage terminase, large subunit, PBSX family
MEVEVRIPKSVFLKCYWHLLKSAADINFLWGGRDSGKSFFIAQILIMKCLYLKRFRCVLIRKTYRSIEDSQYQMLKDVVEDWKIGHLFKFTKNPLRITCVNGNSFMARGCDDPNNMKSITNPSHAWYEEGNQLTQDEYTISSSTLRGRRISTKVEQWFSFNPEAKGHYEDFWLYKNFFAGHKDLTFSATTNVTIRIKNETKVVPINYTSTHTTYNDNKYCPDQRRALLEMLEKTNPHYHKVFALGLWGNKSNDDPFAFAFDRKKHTGVVARTLGLQLYASFDFNRNPICCSVFQILPGEKIRCLETVKLANSDIYKLCDYLMLHYPNALWIVTGDATGSGSNAMVEDGLNYYKIIKAKMRLSKGQFKVPTVNPKIKENQVLVNAVLALLDCVFDEVKAKGLIFDCENVGMLPTGEIDKTNRTNESMQADALDTFRYFLNTFFKHVLKLVAHEGDKNKEAA